MRQFHFKTRDDNDNEINFDFNDIVDKNYNDVERFISFYLNSPSGGVESTSSTNTVCLSVRHG